jgi:hypothetical protein
VGLSAGVVVVSESKLGRTKRAAAGMTAARSVVTCHDTILYPSGRGNDDQSKNDRSYGVG